MGPINRSVTYHDDVHFLDISYLRLTLPTQDNILYKLDTWWLARNLLRNPYCYREVCLDAASKSDEQN